MSNEKDKTINFGRKHVNWTNSGKPRPLCRITGCEHPSQANSTLCPVHYKEHENQRRAKLRKVESVGNTPFMPMKGKPDLIVVMYEEGVVAGAYMYKCVRKLSSFETKVIYGESPRKVRMDDGTLILTAIDARRKK